MNVYAVVYTRDGNRVVDSVHLSHDKAKHRVNVMRVCDEVYLDFGKLPYYKCIEIQITWIEL